MSEKNTQLEIEDLWRDRLEEAKQRYRRAVEDFRKIAEDGEGADNPNLFPQVEAAIAEESSARLHYIETLRIFNDLVVHGKRPQRSAP